MNTITMLHDILACLSATSDTSAIEIAMDVLERGDRVALHRILDALKSVEQDTGIRLVMREVSLRHTGGRPRLDYMVRCVAEDWPKLKALLSDWRP